MAPYGKIKADAFIWDNGGSDTETSLSTLGTKASTTGDTFTGDLLIDNAKELRLGEPDGSGTNYTGLKAQAQSGDITLTLPAVAPTANQVLKADASTPTTLTWASDVALTLVDEDDFSSDSATAVPSQQSTKAYIAATSQPLDTDLTVLSGCNSGVASAIAILTQAEVEVLDGATVTTDELNKLDGFTGDKDDLIYAKDLKATGVTDTEFDYLDGVTSNIQTQLDAKGTSNLALTGDQTWTGSQRGSVSTATHSSGATYDFDMNAANNFKVTLSVTAELGFSNMTAGQSGTIEVVNGAFTPTFGSECHFVGGTVPSLTQSATSYLAYFAPSNSVVFVQTMLDVKAPS